MRRTALAALAAIICSQAPALAVTLDPSPDAQGRAVVNSVFRDYLAQRVGIQVETGIVDVEADGVAEIVARFVHSESCREKGKQCRTVVLRHGPDKKWGIILDRPADRIEVPKAPAEWLFTEITVDGGRWKWNGKAYGPVLDGVGTKVVFAPVPKEMTGAIAVAFGQGAAKLAASPDSDVSFEFARPKASAQGEQLLVRMNGKVACGEAVGCPVRLLDREGDTWRPVLSGWSLGNIEISRVSRGGRNDILLGTGKGYVVVGWSGTSYGLADVVEATATTGN